jgi:hypothetical protein
VAGKKVRGKVGRLPTVQLTAHEFIAQIGQLGDAELFDPGCELLGRKLAINSEWKACSLCLFLL